MSNTGTLGYGQSVFKAAYEPPGHSQNLAQAKKLIQQAGATGKTITIGTSSQLANIAAVTGAYQAAAQAIGLKVKLHSVSAQNYIDFFIDPNAGPGIDGFLTVNYGDYADPAGLLSTFELPGGSRTTTTSATQHHPDLERARSTANPDQRAALMVAAEKLTHQLLPWIPRPADHLAADEQEAHRRGVVVHLHVRAVGQQPGRDRLRRCAAVLARRLVMLAAACSSRVS